MTFYEAKQFLLNEYNKITPMGAETSYIKMSVIILRALKPNKHEYISRSHANLTLVLYKDKVSIAAVDFFELNEKQIVDLALAVKNELREHKLLLLD